ncbi:MAG TPA: molybdenum cofactor biosynthesis protein MoaE [Candidatus Azoamicus sp.]
MNIIIKISKTELKYNIIQNTLNDVGAIVSFLGIIKNKNNNKQVQNIHYYIFDALFFSILKKYCISIIKNNNNTHIYINQYSGMLDVGKINLIILVQSKDRKNAFLICHKLLEFIKNNSPVWKKETYINGTSEWINV